MRKLLTIVLLAASLPAFSQEATSVPRSGIALNAFGVSGLVGLTYDVILFNRVDAEVGYGAFGYGAGLTYLIKRPAPQTFVPYTGLKYGFFALLNDNYRDRVYVPFGLTRYGKNGRFFISADIGPGFERVSNPDYDDATITTKFDPYTQFIFHGNVKLGVRLQVLGSRNR